MSARRPLIAATAGLALLVMLAAGAAATRRRFPRRRDVRRRHRQSIGWVRLVEDGTGTIHVNVHVAGLTPGLHGIHIHAIGACSPTFAAAGGHYNPRAPARAHNPSGAHAGDLPNLIVNAQGIGHLDTTTDGVTISSGPTTLFDSTSGAVGSAFIIHASEDDQVTQPIGNSGARVACAVIEAD